MVEYIVLCCILLVGAITHQSWGRSLPSHTVWYKMTPEEFWLKKHRSVQELKPFANHQKNEHNTKKIENAEALRQLLEDFGQDIVDDVNILKNAQQKLVDQYAVDLAYDTQVKKNYAHKEHDAGAIDDTAPVNDDVASVNEVDESFGDEIILKKTYA